jgi:hypothetical protein
LTGEPDGRHRPGVPGIRVVGSRVAVGWGASRRDEAGDDRPRALQENYLVRLCRVLQSHSCTAISAVSWRSKPAMDGPCCAVLLLVRGVEPATNERTCEDKRTDDETSDGSELSAKSFETLPSGVAVGAGRATGLGARIVEVRLPIHDSWTRRPRFSRKKKNRGLQSTK